MKKRILTIALVVALLATCFAGTYAYLTDTHAQKNTFTTGNVLITLDEAEVVKDEASGNLVADGNNRVVDGAKVQDYHLYPAMTVVKDPTIRVDAESENAWIAAKITVTKDFDLQENAMDKENVTKAGALFDGTAEVVAVENGDTTVLYVYMKAVQKANATIVLFNGLKIPETWTNTEMTEIAGMEINVQAFAVQANGFADCKTAMQTAFSTDFPSANP